jgi:hypothetical protein
LPTYIIVRGLPVSSGARLASTPKRFVSGYSAISGDNLVLTARKRNLVERCINKLKQFRHVATRYDRKALAYLAFAKLAAVRLWLWFFGVTKITADSLVTVRRGC